MQLTKDRPYLIFWLGQVCFDAVEAKQNVISFVLDL